MKSLLALLFGIVACTQALAPRAPLGAVTVARCLYLSGVRRQTKQPQPEDVIRDYERCNQQHTPVLEEAKCDS